PADGEQRCDADIHERLVQWWDTSCRERRSRGSFCEQFRHRADPRGQREYAGSSAGRLAKRGYREWQIHSAIDADGGPADESEVRWAESVAATGEHWGRRSGTQTRRHT